MGLDGYYYDKIQELELKEEETNRIPVCYNCQSVIQDIFYRTRYQENQDHEVFKIFFHYFPPCFDFDKFYGSENGVVLADGYQIQTKYLAKHKEFSKQLTRLDRINLGIDPSILQGYISYAVIRPKKNQVTSLIRSELVHRMPK